MDFITLSCPACGGKLQITKDIDRFACAHCGQEHLVRREGGIVYLAPLVEGIQRIQTGVDKTAAELAVVRLTKEIGEIENRFRTISAYPLNDLQAPSFWEKSLPILSSIVLLIGFFSLSGAGLFLILLAIAGLVTAGVLNTKRTRAIQAQRDEMLTELQAQLRQKQMLLSKNHRIADS